MTDSDRALMQQLQAPFAPGALKCRPGTISGSRAMVLFYATAPVVMDRLDEVLGVAGWWDQYEVLADGNVLCRLSIRIGDQVVTKCDVGSPSEQADLGDARKASFSDALKRAAVKFGIGRGLYKIPAVWADYDAAKKRFTKTPVPPAVATRPVA